MKPMKVLDTITPREMRPQREGGADWGRPSPILMRQDSTGRRLIWWPAGSHWSGMGGIISDSASLQLEYEIGDFLTRGKHTEILEGGRFSRARTIEVKDKIDEFFDRDVDIASLNLKRTLVIE